MRIRRRFVKNVVANLVRGGLGAIVALLLPPVLVRHMTPASYTVWILVLQTAAYASYLNFGLQTAIGRYVAYANEKKNCELRDSVFSTAFAGLCCAALVAIVCIAVAAVAIPALFPSVPQPLISQMRLALLIVGFAMAAELPASGWNGVFIGIARYEIPALTTGCSRFLSALGLILAALTGRSLVVMATIIAATNLTSYLAQYIVLRRVVPDLRFQPALVRRSTTDELLGYCLGLTVMSFAMLLISGLDLLLVGRFEFAVVTPYSVSLSIIALIIGLLSAIISVMMPHAAALHARRQPNELGQLVVSVTRLSVLLLVLTGVPVVIYAGPILRLWIGQRYVAAGVPLLCTLVAANMIRLIGLPYATVLVAAGQQNYIKLSPLSEGISNFLASVFLGSIFGGVGVAVGTLLGSFVSIATHVLYSMPRTQPVITIARRSFLASGILAPLVATSPLIVTAVVSLLGIQIQPIVFVGSGIVSIFGAGVVVLRTDRLFERPSVSSGWPEVFRGKILSRH